MTLPQSSAGYLLTTDFRVDSVTIPSGTVLTDPQLLSRLNLAGAPLIAYDDAPATQAMLALFATARQSLPSVQLAPWLTATAARKGAPFTAVVGSKAAGDSLAVCDFLDTGDGAMIRYALDAAAGAFTATGVRSTVFVRPGRYVMAATGTQIAIPQGVTLRGSGKLATVVVAPSTGATAWRAFQMAQADGAIEDIGIELPVIVATGGSNAMKGAIEVSALGCAVRRVRIATVTSALTFAIEQWVAGVMLAGSGATPLDTVIDELDVEYLAASSTVPVFLTFHAIGSNAETRANTGSTRGPRFTRIYFNATAAAALSRDFTWFVALRIRQDLAFEAQNIRAIDADEAVYVIHSATGVVATMGPKIHHVEHELPAAVPYASASVRIYCRSSNASTLQGVAVSWIRAVDRSTGARAGEFMPINVVMHATWTGTLRSVQVDHVDGEDNTASGGAMSGYLAPLGACTVTDVTFDNVRLRGRSTTFVAGYSTGTLTGVKLQGIKAGTIAIGSSNTNAIAIGMQGTLTDSGTTTAKAANN